MGTQINTPKPLTEAELLADVEFLAQRCLKAGYCSFGGDKRDFGMSSNSIVAVAYGIAEEHPSLPFDRADLAACERMWKKLPEHRKTPTVIAVMELARTAIQEEYGT